jgi:hypothetical protein
MNVTIPYVSRRRLVAFFMGNENRTRPVMPISSMSNFYFVMLRGMKRIGAVIPLSGNERFPSAAFKVSEDQSLISQHDDETTDEL